MEQRDARVSQRPGAAESTQGAAEFVRFCYSRRRVGWPELYHEMCAVAARGAFRGMGYSELAECGIGLSLPDLPRLAVLAGRLVEEDALRASEGRVETSVRRLVTQPN